MRTAGRPASPTIHPRTKPEGEEFASRNRATNDWFRHDGKNVEPQPTVVPKLPTEVSKEAAAKNKGESGDWFGHDEGPNPSNGTTDVGKAKSHKSKGPRCRGEDAMKIHDKIYGKDEAWYRFEDNQNYVDPRPKSRLGTAGAEECKARIAGKGEEKSWYMHEHNNDNYSPPAPKTRTPSKQGTEIKQKMEGKGTPEWYTHEHKQNGAVNGDASAAIRPNRLMSPDAEEYLDRNKKGSASDWFSHVHKNGDIKSPEVCASPRLRTPESHANAKKLVGESGEWFKHDANRHYSDPSKPERCPSAAAKQSKQQNNGSQMQRLLTSPQTNGVSNGHDNVDGRIKPEAQAYAKKSVNGMMSKLMDQDSNKEYSSPRGVSRIKPEAAANAAKNRGVTQECMEGYLDTPRKHGVRRVKPESEGIANRNQGSMAQLMGNYGNLTPSARHNPKTLHGEGVQNAQKSRNCEMQKLIGSYGQLEISGRPVPRLQSSEAHANARRFQGEAASVIYGD